MAIRKDLDDMLNNLKNSDDPNAARPTPKKLPKLNRAAEMSADDIVKTLKYKSEEAPKKKKRIVIGELPDYEALIAQEREREQEEKAEQERAEQERIAAEKAAEEQAEQERLAAEKAAEEQAEKARQEHIRAENERLEAERKAAEKAEKARIAAAKKAEAERVKAEKIARRKKQKEEREAEKAKRAAEKLAAEEAERERLAAEAAENDAENTAEEPAEAVAETAPANEDDSALDMLDSNDSFSIEEIENEPESPEETAEAAPENEVSGGIFDLFRHILSEDPDEVMSQPEEADESGEEPAPVRVKSSSKRSSYAVLGVVFAVFACIGLVTVVAKCIGMLGNLSSGSNKDGFETFLYPAVIMDIESFDSPADLSSEQILTAAIWSMILDGDITNQYELTFDVVTIPAADVESAAVQLFGDQLPALQHTTVGPASSPFYYNDETKSYNVPVAPVTFTYSPEIRGAKKSGADYILVVDYIDELPAWLPKTSSKSVEFVITESGSGYRLKAMKILSTSTNAV